MPDNLKILPSADPSAVPLAYDSCTVNAIANVLVALGKVGFGANDVWTYVTTTAGLPVQQQGTWTVTANAGTGNFASNLTQVGGSAIAIGQGLMAASLPVALASNHSAILVNGGVTAATLAGASGNTSVSTAGVGNWQANAQATAGTPSASKAAAGAGIRHVCKGISIVIACNATAQTPVIVNLRDGATGAGTIIRSWALSALIGTTVAINESDLNLVGTANTAMTLEFAGATVAASIASVNLNGYDAS